MPPRSNRIFKKLPNFSILGYSGGSGEQGNCDSKESQGILSHFNTGKLISTANLLKDCVTTCFFGFNAIQSPKKDSPSSSSHKGFATSPVSELNQEEGKEEDYFTPSSKRRKSSKVDTAISEGVRTAKLIVPSESQHLGLSSVLDSPHSGFIVRNNNRTRKSNNSCSESSNSLDSNLSRKNNDKPRNGRPFTQNHFASPLPASLPDKNSTSAKGSHKKMNNGKEPPNASNSLSTPAPSSRMKDSNEKYLNASARLIGTRAKNVDMEGLRQYQREVLGKSSDYKPTDIKEFLGNEIKPEEAPKLVERKESKLPLLFQNFHLEIDRHLKLDSKFTQQISEQETSLDEKIEAARTPKSSRKGDVPRPEIPDDADEIISAALKRPKGEEMILCNNVPIRPEDLATLKPGIWLNNEVINFYFNMILFRANQDPLLPKLAIQSTFFYSTYKDHGYKSVCRYSKRFDVFEKDLYLIPIHLGNHWACACINFIKKRVEYYDSLGGYNSTCIDLLWDWLGLESLDKKKKPFDYDGWTKYCPAKIPHQQNGFDCGVFTCVYAEHLSREAPFNFSQKDMPYFRRRIQYELMTKALLI